MIDSQMSELIYGIVDVVERNRDIYFNVFISPEHVNISVYPYDPNEED